MIRHFSIVLSFVLLWSCANKAIIQQTHNFPVKIEEVSYQHWVSGVRGGGSGTNFYIRFSRALPKDIKIQKIYFRRKVETVQQIDDLNYVVFFRGNANWERGNLSESDSQGQAISAEPPVRISDKEAVLTYTQKEKEKFYKIKNALEKEMPLYPSARPRN